MALGLISSSILTAIADAIRNKLGTQSGYKPSQMASAILSIPVATLIQKSITQNGTYYAAIDDADGYSQVNVNVSGGGGEVEPDLPSAYQRVAYLDFTPSIGIVITIPTSGYFLYTADFSPDRVASSPNNDVFGYRLSSRTEKDFEIGNTTTSYSWIRTPGNDNGLRIADQTSASVGVRMAARTLLVNPRSTAMIGKYSYNYSSSSVNNLAFDGKFYSLKAIDILTGNTAAWFVPCYRKSDNQVGVYDHIAQDFYYSTYAVGSGYSIVAGPDAN